MKYLLSAEELAQFVAPIVLLYFSDTTFSWWAWLLLFFAPDLAMIGYLAGPRLGAVCYNAAHHKGILLAGALISWWMGWQVAMALFILWYAHSAFDRLLGYGLKYPDSFQHTHLGWIGRR